MNVLWIVNGPIIGKHREMLNLPLSQSGGWLVAAYESLKHTEDLTLGIVCTYDKSKILSDNDGKHKFYIIPCRGDKQKDISDDSYNQSFWKKIISDFAPDIIQLWGTEYSHGLCALKVAGNIPSVVYIQGLMSQIAYHQNASIPFIEQLKYTTLRDIIRHDCFWQQQSRQLTRASIEKNILHLSKNVIVENDWCAGNCQVIEPECQIFKSLLPINNLFSNYNWSLNDMHPHTIFTVASPSQIKGLHILLKALPIIKTIYPDVVLNIPGSFVGFKHGSYYKLIQSYISKFNLDQNIRFLGQLTPEQMAQQMSLCNVFVMSSAIENHSSTLIEAMMVGAPCIASNVGGVSYYARHGENALLYRYEEYQTLAYLVVSLFSHKKKLEKIATNARVSTREQRLSINLKEDLLHCYTSLKDNLSNI